MVTLERFEKGYLELFHAPRLIEGYTAKVITDACFLILEEIPCEEYRVNIDGYNEVLNLGDIQEENDYFVDYTNCIVYFHGSKMGKNITITDYWGMGLNFIGANRIITRISTDGRIIETLEEVINSYPDLLNKLQEAREIIVLIQELIDRIVPTQNPDFTVGKTNWVEFTQNGEKFYKYTLTHNLHSRNLIVSMMNLDTSMNMPSPAFSYDDENKITVYSVERVNAKYVICSKYYYGAENLNSEIIQEVRDARFGKGSLNQKIAEMCTFMDNVNTTLTKKVNDIQIGTRNYLLNTGLKDNTSSFSGLNNEVVRVTTMKTPSENNCFYSKVSNKTNKVWRGAVQEVTSGFSIGDTMTFSIQTYVTDEVATDEGLFIEVVGVASDDSTRTFVVNKQANASDVNKWVKYDLTFVVPKNTVKIKCLSYVVKNGSWYTGDYKLEKGNKATDWSPNPKDIDNAINLNKTNIAINTSNITTNKNNITSLQNKTSHIKYVSTIEELGTAIDNAVNGDIIYIKQGKYKPNRSYEIPKGVTIKGSGINNCIFDCSNTSINNVFRNKLTGLETGYSTFDIVIEGINFNGYDTINNITVIAMAHAMNVIIRDCMFQRFNSWHNIEFNGCHMCYIQRNRFSDYGYTSGGNPTEVIQIDYCRDTVNYPWTCNYDATHCKNIYIEENSFYKIKTTATGAIGTHNYAPEGHQHKDIFVRYNTLDTVECFFHLLGSKRIHLDNNSGEVVGCFAKIGTNGHANQTSGTICNNQISGDLKTKLFFQNREVEGRFVWGVDTTITISDFSISNNNIREFSRHTIGLTCCRTTITGNTIYMGGYNGIYLHGGNQISCTGNSISGMCIIDGSCRDIKVGGNSNISASKIMVSGNIANVITGDNVNSTNVVLNTNVAP